MTLFEYLASCDDATLAAIWCDFNGGDWPDAVPAEFMPPWWNGEPAQLITPRDQTQRQIGFLAPVQAYIESRVSDEQIRAAWQERLTRTQELILRQAGVPGEVLGP